MEEEQFRTISSTGAGRLSAAEIVAGKYRIESVLGVGGMGTVYRVTNIFFEKQFALKVLDVKCAPDAVLIQRFQNEAKAAFSLNHPNLVRVHDFGILEAGDPYLVMDLVVGETLADLIKRKTVLTPEEYKPILEDVCNGLSYAHAHSVIHRDVKPGNIMVSFSPQRSVKILDFGIAKIVNEELGQLQELTRTGEIFGSPLYMSPEQCSGGVIDQRTDIYSLGCVTYEALTGAPPHVGVNALRTMMLHKGTAVVPMSEASLGLKFSPQWEHVVATMLAKEPSQRYSDALEIIDDLNPFAGAQLAERKRLVATASSATEEQSAKVSLSALQLGIIVVSVMLASSIATYFILQMVSPSPVQAPVVPGSEPIKKEATPALDQGKPKVFSLDAIEPVVSFVTEGLDGKRWRRIKFPSVEIGRVVVMNSHYERNGDLFVARNSVDVPADARLGFIVAQTYNDLTIAHPEIIDRIDPNLFSNFTVSSNSEGIDLRKVAESADRVSHFTLSVEEKQNVANSRPERRSDFEVELGPEDLLPGFERCLLRVRHWKQLKSVNFENVVVTDGMVNAVEQLKGLECIRLIHNESVTPLFPSLSSLPSMAIMEFRYYNPVFLWAKPANFKNLEELTINCDITPEVLSGLRRLPRLKTLKLWQNHFKPPPALIDWIAASNQLETVSMDFASLSSKDVRRLLANRAIKKLRVAESLSQKLEAVPGFNSPRLEFVTIKSQRDLDAP